MKTIGTITIYLLILYTSNAQTHDEFWSKLTISKKINNKFLLACDVQFRQQANYKIASKNIFEEPNTRAIRLWLNYKLKNNFTITVAPIAYFANEDIINKNGTLSNTNELRIAFAFTKSFNWKNAKQNNRILVEERFLNYDAVNTINQYRYRIQNSINLLVKKLNNNCNLNYQFSNEFIIKTQQSQISFDQNRIQNALQLQLHKIEFNIGYQYTIQASSNNLIYRNQYLFNTSILL